MGDDQKHLTLLPLTFKGVAGAARVPLGRLLLWQLLAAIAGAGACCYFIVAHWLPVISDAFSHLPAEAEIRGGKLTWPGGDTVRLADGRGFSIVVNPQGAPEVGQRANLQLEVLPERLRLVAFSFRFDWPYPDGWRFDLSRETALPWWGARKPFLVLLAAVAVGVSLFLSWWTLATLYFLPVRVWGFFADRELSLKGAWFISNAALFPGALFFSAAIGLHALGIIGLPILATAGFFHMALGWFYLLGSLRHIPKTTPGPGASGGNPFASSAEEEK